MRRADVSTTTWTRYRTSPARVVHVDRASAEAQRGSAPCRQRLIRFFRFFSGRLVRNSAPSRPKRALENEIQGKRAQVKENEDMQSSNPRCWKRVKAYQSKPGCARRLHAETGRTIALHTRHRHSPSSTPAAMKALASTWNRRRASLSMADAVTVPIDLRNGGLPYLSGKWCAM